MTVLTIKQVDNRLATLKKSGYLTVNQTVQEVAVGIISHANDTGDCRRALVLTQIVPADMRYLLRAFFSACSPINVNLGKTRKDDKVSLRKEKQKTYNPFDIEKAKANNWWENPFQVEPPAKPLNSIDTYYRAVNSLIDRMGRETAEDANKVDPEHIQRVQALRAAMRAAFLEYRRGDTQEEFDNAPPEEETIEDDTADEVAAAAAA